MSDNINRLATVSATATRHGIHEFDINWEGSAQVSLADRLAVIQRLRVELTAIEEMLEARVNSPIKPAFRGSGPNRSVVIPDPAPSVAEPRSGAGWHWGPAAGELPPLPRHRTVGLLHPPDDDMPITPVAGFDRHPSVPGYEDHVI